VVNISEARHTEEARTESNSSPRNEMTAQPMQIRMSQKEENPKVRKSAPER